MRVLITIGVTIASVLIWRWGMAISSPHRDSLYALQVIGRLERIVTRFDAGLTRLKVAIIDRLELDQLTWIRLRAQYTPEMS
jgi:hypothetical protein